MALIGEMKYLQIGTSVYEIPTSELPIASSSTLGGIKVGTNLSIDSTTGVLSVTGIPTKVSDLQNDSGFTTNTGTVTSVRVQASSPLSSSTSTAQSTSLNTIISFSNQNKNLVLAGPSSGSSAAAPSFRSLVADDIPDLSGIYLTSYTETDPTVPSWAKASTKPTYTASEVDAVAKTGDTMTGQLIVPHDTNTLKGGVCFDNANAYPNITIVGGGGYYDSSYGTEYPYLTFYYGTSSNNKVILNNIDTPRENYNAANKLYVDNKFSSISYPVTSVNGQTGAVTLSIPTISITQNLTSGTKSATINISGTDYDIYSMALPTVSSSDNDKVLMVVNGAWSAANLPIYNGGVS